MTLGEKAKLEVKRILEEHKVLELPQNVLQQMDDILIRAKRRWKS